MTALQRAIHCQPGGVETPLQGQNKFVALLIFSQALGIIHASAWGAQNWERKESDFMEEERDLVVFTDDEGNEKTMEVLDYFFYEGQEYAVLTEADECESCDEACECGDEADAYIMKVVPAGEDEEEFLPVEDELMDRLIEFVQNELYADDEDEEEEENGEDEEE